MKFFKFNIATFIFLFFFLCLMLWYITYIIILPDFKQLQLNKNTKNVEVLISKMDTNIYNIKKIINDYSKWDDTYEFMLTRNNEYLYDNFREGTSTLEDLDVDFIIYTNFDKKVFFSKYVKDSVKSVKIFEKNVLDYLISFNNYNSLHFYKNKPLYLIKSEILKSDESGTVNGHIIAGKFITDKRLRELTNIFSKASLINKEKSNGTEIELILGGLTKVKVSTKLEDTIINNINFFNTQKFLFSMKTSSQMDIVNHGKKTILYFSIVLSSFLFIVFYLLYKNQKAIEQYNVELEEKVKHRTQELNRTIRILEDSNKKQQEQEQLLIQQNKLASMGEMIGNIAHQWRQPLNALGLVMQNINISYELNDLNDALMEKSVKKVNLLTNNMSKTIDDFGNFFKPNKEKKSFFLNILVKETLELVDATLEHHNIQVESNIDAKFNVIGFKNEFSQTLLNIVNNAKDALLENNIPNPKIKIEISSNDKYGIITIRDNAGGIQTDIIEKIFDPYFTTKEEGKGTGLGLYMSKIIIEKNMGGILLVENHEKGAMFTVKIPLNKDS